MSSTLAIDVSPRVMTADEYPPFAVDPITGKHTASPISLERLAAMRARCDQQLAEHAWAHVPVTDPLPVWSPHAHPRADVHAHPHAHHHGTHAAAAPVAVVRALPVAVPCPPRRTAH